MVQRSSEHERYGHGLVLAEVKVQPDKKHQPTNQSVQVIGLKQADADDVLLQIDGALTDDDDALGDNSRFDAHVFEGQAGQIIRITLESDEFDTYLLLEDPSGERIAENDDGSDGTNSEIIVKLPSDGTYRILANSYDSTGRGTYRLTMVPATADELHAAQSERQANQLLQQGNEQYQVSQWREALESWEAALTLYRELENRAGEANTLGNIGIIYDNLGDYPQALNYYEQSLALQQELGNHLGEANSLLNIGLVNQNLGDYLQALDYYEQSLALQQELGNLAGEALALGNIGTIYQNLSDYSQALDYYDQSLTLARELGNRAGEANTLNNIGLVNHNLGDYPQALDYYEQSLSLAREFGNRAGEASILNNIGLVYQILRDYLQALDYYDQSLALQQELGNRLGEANSLLNIGEVNRLLGDYPTGLEYYDQSLALYREIGNRLGEANTLGNIGIVYDNLGDYPQALNYYEQSLALQQELGNRLGEANSLLNIGEVNRLLGDYPQALNYYEQSLVLQREIGNRAGEAITLNNIGIVNRLLGNDSQSLEYYEQSLALTRELGNRAGEANALGNIGNVHRLLGENPRALDYYEQSLAISRELGNRAGEALTLNNIGLIYRNLGDDFQALDYYEQSLAIKRDIGDRAGEANTLNNIGILLEAQEQPELAIVFLKQSVNTYEVIREQNQALTPEQQASYTSTIEDTYRRLADLLLQQNRVFEAQRVLDLLKVQELDSFLRGVRSTADSEQGIATLSPEQQIIARYQALLDQAIEIKKELYDLEQQETLTADEEDRMIELQGQRQAIQREFRRFIYSDEIQAFVQELTPNEIDWNLRLAALEELQNNLAQLDHAVLLYPLILEDRLELVLMTPFGPPIHRSVDVTKDDLVDQIGAFRYALEDSTVDAKPTAQQLYEWLIQPIEDDLANANAETIIYAPDGPLRYAPLAALYDPGDSADVADDDDNGSNGEWLIERFRINHITALSLSDLTTEDSGDINVLAGALTSALDVTVGGRPFRFSNLPFAQEEVEGLSQTVRSVTSLLDTDFSRTTIEQQANRHTILHLATHAKFLIGQPEDSFIVFGDGSHVTLNEMKYGWLTLNQVDLVVLSACETAIGSDLRDANGEEILGFGYLMEQAGARASIASLWAVDDGGTQLLMNEFYDALERGNLTKVEALQRAQRALITAADDDTRGFAWDVAQRLDIDPDDLSHPYYWAPFILIGNGL
jgi:CHAT domain-containing protein